MAIKFYNPTSAGRRAGSVIDYKAVLTKFRAGEVAACEASIAPTAAIITASSPPSITAAATSGSIASSISSAIAKMAWSPTSKRSNMIPIAACFIALIKYEDGVKAYILCPNGLKAGAKVVSGPDAPPELGQLHSAGEHSDGA